MLAVSNIQSNKLNFEAQLLMLVFITVKPNRLATILVGLILVHNFGRSNFGFCHNFGTYQTGVMACNFLTPGWPSTKRKEP